MDYDDFMALRQDQRDERLAEFLNRREGEIPRIWFDATIEHKMLPVKKKGHEHPNDNDVIACLKRDGVKIATARRRKETGVWHAASTALDTAREMFVAIQTSLATAQHANNVARRLRNQLTNSVLWEINYTPEVGEKVIVITNPYFGRTGIFGATGEIIHVWPPNDHRGPVYNVRLDDRDETVAVYHVMPPLPDPDTNEETPHVR